MFYEPGDIECDAIVRRGRRWEWVADIRRRGILRRAPPGRVGPLSTVKVILP